MRIKEKLKSANIYANPKRLYYKPSWLVLGVNNLCNLHCKMCDVGTATLNTNFATNLVGAEPLNMPLVLFKKIIDQAKEFCPDVKVGYAFTEPLIYPHLIESLQYANAHNIFTTITTNALTLKKTAVEICEAGLNELFISLDGPESIHNFIRGHKSSFQRAIDGIEEVLKQEVRPEISVFCVITEWNIGYLKEFVEFFKKFPLKNLGFMHTNFTPNEVADVHNSIWGTAYPATSSNVEQTDIKKMDLNLLWDEIKAIKSGNYPFSVSFSPEIESKEKLMEFYLEPGKIIGKKCNDAFHNIMIKSDGSVIPAHGRCYNLTLGNIYNENLGEIWNSKIFGQFRSDLIKAGGLFPACARCCSAF